MSEPEAYAAFKAVRFADNGGKPVCPSPGCGCTAVYEYRAPRKLFKCKACEKQFTATSRTIFASRKMYYQDILSAICIFVNGVNGVAALRLAREINCSYKTAFVMAHKLREVFGAMATAEMLTGVVEIDGAWVGGKIKMGNIGNKGQRDRQPRNGKRRSVVSMRERGRGGRSLSFVFMDESEALDTILKRVHPSATVVTDEGSHWNILSAYFDQAEPVNHSKEWSKRNGVHTNNVESLNSRLRRNERGVHHHISGRYLQAYATEVTWREDFRRTSNGDQFAMVLGAAAKQPISRDWKGYWQRRGPRPPKIVRAWKPRPKTIVSDFRPRL
jgi:transposase-like protein